jgi:hypothetical protein
MKKFILTFAIATIALCGFSQDKGVTQLSVLHVSSSDVTINVSSPSLTYYFIDNMGLTLGIANFNDINLGARYYVKDNNFAYAGYGTNSESLNLGLGKSFGWGDHIQIEPRLNFTDVISDDRNLNLSVHLNMKF